MQSPEQELPALAQRAQRGDVEAYNLLFGRLSGPVLNYVYRMLGDRQAAEDVTQEAFIRAFDQIQRLGPPWDFKSWVYRIASNMAVDHLRRQRRFVDVEEPEPMVVHGAGRRPVEGHLQEQEQRDQVWGILGALPTNYRQALVLREFNGFDYRQIAAALECSYANARQLVHRARMRFRDLYALRMAIATSLERCRVLGDLLSSYHDHELDESQILIAEEHIAACELCQQAKKDMKMVGALLAFIPPLLPDPAWAASVLEKILSKVEAPERGSHESNGDDARQATSERPPADSGHPSSGLASQAEGALGMRPRRSLVIQLAILSGVLGMAMLVGAPVLAKLGPDLIPWVRTLGQAILPAQTTPAALGAPTPTAAQATSVPLPQPASTTTLAPVQAVTETITLTPTPTSTGTPSPTPTGTATRTPTALPAVTDSPTATITATPTSQPPKDSTPPTVQVQHAPTGLRMPSSKDVVTFTAEASDNVGVALIEIWLQVGKGRLTMIQACKYAKSCRAAGGPYPSGESLLYFARAFDQAGNSAETKSFTIRIY